MPEAGALTASERGGAAHPPGSVPLDGDERRSAREELGEDRNEPTLGSFDWLDPLARSLAPQPLRSPPPAPQGPAALPVEFEQLMRDLVRRAAWGGDRRRGTARIELGAGELAGATLLVEADANDLRIDLELPAGVAAEPWRERLASRLNARGFAIRELNVY